MGFRFLEKPPHGKPKNIYISKTENHTEYINPLYKHFHASKKRIESAHLLNARISSITHASKKRIESPNT